MEAWEKVSVENHDLSKELKRLKRDLDDTCATLDEQKRQNKSMGDENQNLSKSFRNNTKILPLNIQRVTFLFSQTIFRFIEVCRTCRKGKA